MSELIMAEPWKCGIVFNGKYLKIYHFTRTETSVEILFETYHVSEMFDYSGFTVLFEQRCVKKAVATGRLFAGDSLKVTYKWQK